MIALNRWISGLSPVKRYLCAFLLGAMVAAALPPGNLAFLLPLSFTVLVWILSAASTKKQAFLAGWWFAWGQFIAGLYWIGVAFTIDADTHAFLMPLPVIVLPAFLAIFSGLATLATHMTGARGLSRILLFTGFWVAFEYVRGVIFTGFPWNLVGYSWSVVDVILQSTAYVGIYGLTLLTVFLASLPALFGETETPRKTAMAAVGGMIALFVILAGAGYVRIPAGPVASFDNTSLRIVQPNIQQTDKWKMDRLLEHLQKIVSLSLIEEGEKPRFYIWPETAVPYYLTTARPLQRELAQILSPGGAIFTGAPRRDPVQQKYWNSLNVLGANGEILDIYDKQHLVPYGEYMPLRPLMEATGLTKLIPALDNMSDFATPDKRAKKVISVPGMPPARALICYEIAFPWEIAPDRPFSWILNVTNDGWFGNTSGPYQHLAIARTRAIEQGVAVIRAANTGISAIIDPYGRIEEKLSLNQTGVLDGSLPMPITERTVYARFGEMIPLILTGLFLLSGLLLSRRNPKNIRKSS